MKDDDITSEVKQYASLTQANGKISWTVPQNNKIKVFIFWVQDLHRKGLQPSLLQFLQDETSEEILSHKAQLEHFIKAADQHISALSKCHHWSMRTNGIIGNHSSPTCSKEYMASTRCVLSAQISLCHGWPNTPRPGLWLVHGWRLQCINCCHWSASIDGVYGLGIWTVTQCFVD